MKTGSPTKALIYAEIKRHLILRASFPSLLKKKLNNNVINEFRGINKRNNIKIVNLLNSHPELQLLKSFKTLPINYLNRKIPENALLIYVIKNNKDILSGCLVKISGKLKY